MSYDNTNKGIISKNDRKTKDTHPDITGTLNVEGVEYFVDGWSKKRNSDGASFYSLSVKRKATVAEKISNEHGFGKQQSYADQSGGFSRDHDDSDPLPF